MSELKPCPFCGGEAQTNEVAGMSNENPPFGWGWVGCQKCRVFMQYNRGEQGKRQAVKAWNARASQATCHYPDGMTIKPDGVHELDPCIYEEIERYCNVTVIISKCKKCGKVDISWERQEDTEEVDY